MDRVEHHAMFGGWQDVYQHKSEVLGCMMKFAIYLPPQVHQDKLPVLYWLSGLTCTEQNFITKSAAQQYAAEHGIIIVAPDTSPRGENVADDPAYDLGQGAGFYLNATQDPWAAHFQMYDYIVHELPALIEAHFPASQKRGISGHSMGGHGALTIALRNPELYLSVSAFSPIVNPSIVPWGQKAFNAYLGADQESWKQYDTVELVKNSIHKIPLLVDQGLGDEFLDSQLQPERLRKVCTEMDPPLVLNLREGYDHSYYFIASFIRAHIVHHALALKC
ncbi:S-formylglutathione hydrolase [Acinetobacter guillouiae]|uniref:S-formylglutathione hydrolase n=1 Tax=Acinetobacter guillouiae TaxID=106649 RepID=UPI0028D344E9|nr:S-formylglutathione hydrolase [Acinetobacter guillouiae]